MRIADRARALWIAALTERGRPRERGAAWAIGVLLGCSPALFVRPWIAMGIATILRKNRLIACVGANLVGNPLVTPWIALVEIQLAHRARTGAWLSLTIDDVRQSGANLLVDWAAGWVVVGPLLALVAAVVATTLASTSVRDHDRRHAQTSARPNLVDRV